MRTVKWFLFVMYASIPKQKVYKILTKPPSRGFNLAISWLGLFITMIHHKSELISTAEFIDITTFITLQFISRFKQFNILSPNTPKHDD